MMRSIRRSVILSFLLTGIGFTGIANAENQDPHPDVLRVMTYNTWYVFAKGKEVPKGKAWVKSQTPDVVALQELTNIQPDTLRELGESW